MKINYEALAEAGSSLFMIILVASIAVLVIALVVVFKWLLLLPIAYIIVAYTIINRRSRQ